MTYPLRLLTFALLTALLQACNKDASQVKTIAVPTRDGISLATDLYFPAKVAESYPTILIRTPYGKALLQEYGQFYSKNGYVLAIQDVRGKYNSTGEWQPYIHEGNDGYDAIEWLAQQEWSNGKIGMVGGSYSGSVQLAAAIASPPHLVTIIPNITPATPYDNTPYENGVFALGWAIRWSDIVHSNISGKDMNMKYAKVFQRNWYKDLDILPVIDLDKEIIGEQIDFWRNWINNDSIGSAYFSQQDYLSQIGKVSIPVFLQSGWFDVASRGTKLLHKSLIESGNEKVKLIIGPWIHSDRSSTQLGPMYLGEEAGIDLFALYLKWFDYWLKDSKNDIMNEPRVQLFNIGPNKWQYAEEYPQSDSKELKYYLKASGGMGNIDGLLRQELDQGSDSVLSYRYDPGNPTSSFHAFMKKQRIIEYKRYIEERNDVLIFETNVLDEPLTIAGPISFVLYASSSALDTDFNITLTGVNKNDEIFPLGQTFAIIRAKFRDRNKPQLLHQGVVYQYNIDLSHTYYTLKPGEKLRVEISSSAFPEFARNLNTGENNLTTTEFVVAEQRIYFNNLHPSHLVLTTK